MAIFFILSLISAYRTYCLHDSNLYGLLIKTLKIFGFSLFLQDFILQKKKTWLDKMLICYTFLFDISNLIFYNIYIYIYNIMRVLGRLNNIKFALILCFFLIYIIHGISISFNLNYPYIFKEFLKNVEPISFLYNLSQTKPNRTYLKKRAR